MGSTSEQLNKFGWDEWFDAKVQEKILAEYRLARVVAVDRDQLLVIDESGEEPGGDVGKLCNLFERGHFETISVKSSNSKLLL
jgi:hypothetical protein